MPINFPKRPFPWRDFWLWLCLASLAGITVFGFATLDFGGLEPGQAFSKLATDFNKMFFSPVIKHFTWAEAGMGLLITLALAFLTTLAGAVLGLVFAFFAARNLGHPVLGSFLRGLVAVIRAIPTVLWVLIFAIGAGLGSVAAVVGMTFHSFGYLMKAYCESMEEMDPGVLEALRASGAGWFHLLSQGVLPCTMGELISWTFLRFEINFTNAVAMGAAAGAGGIGFDLYMASSHYYNLAEVGAVTWIILGTALVLELTASRLKVRKGHMV